MNRKKGLFAVVAALAISSVMAAMAYTSATVTSDAKMIVRSTDMSLLRFDNYGLTFDKDVTSGISDGEMWFDFTQGTGKLGFQPHSDYTYKNLFRIINNQPNANIKVTAKTDLPYLTLKDREGNVLIKDGITQPGVTSSAGTYYTVEFKVPSGAPMSWVPKGSYIEFYAVSEAK